MMCLDNLVLLMSNHRLALLVLFVISLLLRQGCSIVVVSIIWYSRPV